MRTKLASSFAALFLLLFTPAICMSGEQMSFQEGLKLMMAAEKQNAFIKTVAELAHSAKEEELFDSIWPTTRKEFGEEGWHKYLATKIIPYFKEYKSIDRYKHVSPMTLNGSDALVHFGYYQDAAGKRHPYEMVVVESGGTIYLANIYVGRCIKGQHPVCE
jgi:hypothetical protein